MIWHSVIRHIKTLMIILLAASAMYLTTRLWFEELSGSSVNNVMPMLLSRAQPETDSGPNFFVKPARIVTSFGENRYDIMYNKIDESIQKRDCDEAISLTLDSGEYFASSAVELGQLLAAPCYAFHYSVAMPSSTFVITYPQRRNMLTSRIRSFEWVVVKPFSNSGVSVTFLDMDGRAHEYRIDNSVLKGRISNHIQMFAENKQRLVYTYERGSFIPQAEGFVYPKVVMENPYMDYEMLLIDYVRSKVHAFFGSAGSKWDSLEQDLTFSDENTVVKYFRAPAESHNGIDVLEYTNYSVIDRRIMTTLSVDYNSAMRFIARDPTVENEFYLAAVEESENIRVFYFNYVINDLPVSLTSENTTQTGLRYPIEIEIESGSVTRYRKLVYRFVNTDEQMAEVSYENVLNSMLAMDEQSEYLPLANVELRYRINVRSHMVLYWFFELDDGTKFSQHSGGGGFMN